MMKALKYRRVNQILGKNPKLGPFTIAQVIAFVPCLLLAYMAKKFFSLTWTQTLFVIAWLMGSYLILFGNRHWRYTNKFTHPPYFVRGYLLYQSVKQKNERKNRQKNHQRRKKRFHHDSH